MDKKSFVKGLFTGLGISLAGLIVAGGVIACNQKPVTTTPVVIKVNEERGRFVSHSNRLGLSTGNYISKRINNGSFSGFYDVGTYNLVGSVALNGSSSRYSFNYVNFDYLPGNIRLMFGSDNSSFGWVIGCDRTGFSSTFGSYLYAGSSGFKSTLDNQFDVVLTSSLSNTLLSSMWDYWFDLRVLYGLDGVSNHCSYSYTNNNDGTGSVEVTPDTGYTLLDNGVPASWVVTDLSGATLTWFSADPDTGKVVYSVSGASVDGWSATFNARPNPVQTITYNLSYCTAIPLTLPYGDLDYHEVIRIIPDEGYSLKHVVPVITGLSSNVYPAYTYYPQSDYIEIYANQVGVNPSVTCLAIERVGVNYDGLEHCSLLDVSPSPLVGYESRWRFVPDDGYNFLTGLTSPSWSVTPVSSAGWSTEAGVGEYEGKTILVCDATPNDGSMAFDIEAASGIPVLLENPYDGELWYTEDEPLYWLNDNYRRLVTFHAKRGYRFVTPYIRTNVQVGLSYTLENTNKTLKVEYWNATSGVGVYQLALRPVVGLEYEVIGLGSTNIDFGSAWRPIGYVDSNAGLYTGSAFESPVLEFDSIVFSSNGKMYDKVRIVYKVIGNNRFYVDGSDINSDNHMANFYYFDHMDYVNSTNNEKVVAVSTDVRITNEASSAGAGYAEVAIYPETLYWGNTALKSISIYFDDGTTYDSAIGVGTGLTASQILLNGANVTGGSSQGNTGNVGYGGTYDPFVLIATALGTATGFMGYMVLPGLTIGMLMLIPMIITLIIVVFKLVKK